MMTRDEIAVRIMANMAAMYATCRLGKDKEDEHMAEAAMLSIKAADELLRQLSSS